MAKKAFHRMTTGKAKPTTTKGRTGSVGHQNGMGHKAPGITRGNGVRKPSQPTRQTPSWTGGKAPSVTNGRGQRIRNQKTRTK